MRFSVQPLIANLETAPSEETLHQVMRSPVVPDLVLHYFATDCAERALLRLQFFDLPTKDKGFQTLRTKRQWLAQTAKVEGVTIDSAMFVSYIAAVGDVGSLTGPTPSHVWEPLWAAEGAAGWCARKEQAKENAQRIAALACQSITSMYSEDDTYQRRQLDAWCGGDQAVEAERDKAVEAALHERTWQCMRLAWWLALSELTSRLWLAYEDTCPIPPDDAILLDAGFRDFPKPAPVWTGLYDNADPYLR